MHRRSSCCCDGKATQSDQWIQGDTYKNSHHLFCKMENLSLKSIYGLQRGPKELKQYQKRTKHSSQKVETAYIFISECTDNIWEKPDWRWFSHKDEWSRNTYPRDERQKHYAKWGKLDTKGHIMCDFTCKKHPEQPYPQTEEADGQPPFESQLRGAGSTCLGGMELPFREIVFRLKGDVRTTL